MIHAVLFIGNTPKRFMRSNPDQLNANIRFGGTWREVPISINDLADVPPLTTLESHPKLKEVDPTKDFNPDRPTPETIDLNTLKKSFFDLISSEREKRLEKPIENNGKVFDGDKQSQQFLIEERNRKTKKTRPTSWITADNQITALTNADIDELADVILDRRGQEYILAREVKNAIETADDKKTITALFDAYMKR